ncbi:uncharacterized protein LOC142793523 isoform X2 [Rhipicephalus microplus]|uniref:uncharacterized protein LOC142765005 isoform X2 n=1 Tax=Rhipicephalus microplus TaxID=6941 RepID=UPI003F6C2A6E
MCSPIFLYLGSILLHNVAYARSAPPRKNTKDYFCSDNLKCNFGEKQTCLFKDTSTPTLKCVQHQSDCVTLWKGTCGNNGVPKCLDDHTECICFCGMIAYQWIIAVLIVHSLSLKSPIKPRCGSLTSCNFGDKRLCTMHYGKIYFRGCRDIQGFYKYIRTSG